MIRRILPVLRPPDDGVPVAQAYFELSVED